MTEQEKHEELEELAPDWEEPNIELDPKEKKYCCDAEKRRRMEEMREARELEHELREFYDE